MVAYPSDLPMSEVQSIVWAVKNGTVGDNKAEFLHNVWVVQGFVQSKVFGSPNLAVALSAESCDGGCNDDCGGSCDGLGILEEVANSDAGGSVTAQGLNDLVSKVDWATVLTWLLKLAIENAKKK